MDQEGIALEMLRREITKRLRSVCQDVPPNQLELFVDRLAHLQRKYEMVDQIDVPGLDTPGIVLAPAVKETASSPRPYGEVT